MSQQLANNGENLLTALISGSTAASVAATISYPFECLKNQQQLNNHGAMVKYNIPNNYPSTIGQLFKGCSALVIGGMFKNSARLISYNWSSKFMAIDSYDSSGHHRQKTSAPRIFIAGIMSAFIETLWIIPFENIKITMIQNMTLNNEVSRCAKNDLKIDVTGSSTPNKHHKPVLNVFSKSYVSPHAYYTSEILSQYRGNTPSRFQIRVPTKKDSLKIKYNRQPSLTFLGTIKEIYSLRGIYGFTAGTGITMVRQVAISTVWLSTYNATRQLIDPHGSKNEQSWFGHKHTTIQSMGLHLLSSIAVVAATQPLDVIKTHIQSKNGKSIYKDSLSTAYKLVLEQGFRSLFKGSLPRGIKIAINGGLTASVYGYVEGLVNVAGGQTLFTD